MKNQRNVDLVLVNNIKDDQRLKLREIRNLPEIRKWMYSDHLISLNEHLEWIESLKNSSRIALAMIEQDQVIGAFNIYNINNIHKTCEWGWFLDPEKSGSGLGSAIEFTLINFIFNDLDMIKQTVEVLEENIPVVNLHKKFFFIEEGYRRSHIVKGKNRTGYFELGLLKSEWESKKMTFENKFKNFNIKILYEVSI